ncbi:MAG: hypothetical protein GX589_05465 [Deltaproteobacteria bacterium]|nr:hypothetical protein [Deltaproteobacteria bacterium]
MPIGSQKPTENLAEQKSQQDLLFDKIKTLLRETDPDKWRKGGEVLNPEDRFEKPRYTWENVYTLPVSSGVLVARASTPVRSDFQGRGFMLIPVSAPIFTIEMRPTGWHYTELTDPYKRSRNSDRRCSVLAEGSIAKNLYQHIEGVYQSYHDSRQAEFDGEAYEFVSRLLARLREETSNKWERIEDIPGDVHFVAVFDELRVDVSRKYIEGRESYELLVSKFRIQSKIKDRTLAKELFHAAEEQGLTSRLMTLTKALEEV